MSLVTRLQGSVHVLELSGRFDAHVAPAVKEWQDRAATTPYMVVDLHDVTFVDSAALAVLVRGMKRCRQDRGDLRLCGVQQTVRIIFEMTKLDKAFVIFATEAEALRDFGA